MTVFFVNIGKQTGAWLGMKSRRWVGKWVDLLLYVRTYFFLF